MKIKEGFLLHEVAGNSIVVPVGKAEVDFGGMLTLNPVGAFVWKLLETETDEQTVVRAVADEYAVDEATAQRDVHAYMEKLRKAGLLED